MPRPYGRRLQLGVGVAHHDMLSARHVFACGVIPHEERALLATDAHDIEAAGGGLARADRPTNTANERLGIEKPLDRWRRFEIAKIEVQRPCR